ncbi:MAG: hypothetical protein COB14_03710 [Alphaproteobacteria bacterium]|nr:MAG: hypothetical protein COB14_03710 [Alphaproteobacteria bacterium]
MNIKNVSCCVGFSLFLMLVVVALYVPHLDKVEIQPSTDLCSDSQNCHSDEYCSPLNDRAYQDENEEEFVDDGYSIVKKNGFVEVNGKIFPYEKVSIFKEFPYYVTVIKYDDVMYGICRLKKNKIQFSGIQKHVLTGDSCGNLSSSWSNLISKGKFRVSGNIVGDTFKSCVE